MSAAVAMAMSADHLEEEEEAGEARVEGRRR
jgi:hypothetical protein